MSWWKIECLDCGFNTELLTDDWNRIICKDCLVKHEFEQVEDEFQSGGRYPQGAGNSFKRDGSEEKDLGDEEQASDEGDEHENEREVDEGYTGSREHFNDIANGRD